MNKAFRCTIMLAAIIFFAGAMGCISPEHSRGWVPAIQDGERIADFEYVDGEGTLRRFSSLLGDYTVLLFTRCDRDTHGPAAEILEEIVRENRSAWYVKVFGVDVHWSDENCSEHAQCHLVNMSRGLGSLCDVGGHVRQRYGVRESDVLFLIGPKGEVLGSSEVKKSAPLRAYLREEVAHLEAVREEEQAIP